MTETEEKIVQSDETAFPCEFATPEKQEARAFLRERFLRVITGIVDPIFFPYILSFWFSNQDFTDLNMAGKWAYGQDNFEHRKFGQAEMIFVITGKQAEFRLHENSRVAGEFQGCDVNVLDIFVRNLETPLGVVPETILRTTDIIDFNVKNIKTER